MLTRRFDCELRILLAEPMEGIFRAQMLELDLFVLGSDATRLCSLLHDAAEAMIKCGAAQFRCDDIPAGLLHAWICADSDESVAEDAGLVYRGALARVVHVMCENEIQTVNQ